MHLIFNSLTQQIFKKQFSLSRFLPAFTQMKKKLEENYLGSPMTLIDIRIQTGSLFNEIDTFDWKCDDTMGGKCKNDLFFNICFC